MRKLLLIFLIFPSFHFAADSNSENPKRIYDKKNNLIYESWLNGLYLVKTYDKNHQLVGIQFPHGKTLSILGNTLEYDGHTRTLHETNTLGQILAESFSNEQITYTYAPDGALQQIQGTSFFIDLQTITPRLQPPQENPDITCEYDTFGNLIKKTTPERTTTFTYDKQSQLIQVEYEDIVIHNIYDDLGRKIEKITLQNDQEIDHEYFLYDGIFEIASFDAAKRLKELRILHPKNPLHTVFLEKEGKITFPICSQQGHTLALCYPDQRPVVIDQLRLYGEDTHTLLHPWAYTGHRYDPEIKQYYFGKRHYDPELLAWTTPDPLKQSSNPYEYLLGDPLQYIDLDGQWAGAVLRFVVGVTAEMMEAAAVAEAAGAAAGAGILIEESVRTNKELQQKSKLVEDEEKEVATNPETEEKKNTDVYVPDRPLPRDKRTKEPVPDTDAPHTQLGTRESQRTGEKYPQVREFDKDGKPVRDIDFTDHDAPKKHPYPHQHRHIPNKTGGSPKRGDPEPLPEWNQ